MESKLTNEQLQSWNNFTYALRKKNLDNFCKLTSTLNVVLPDRIKLRCDPGIQNELDCRTDFSRDSRILKKSHLRAIASWRENITTYSMQLCLCVVKGVYFLDIDCDYGRPFYDVIGWIIHGFECGYNKLTGSVTNPLRVRKVWNKRGYGIPPVS